MPYPRQHVDSELNRVQRQLQDSETRFRGLVSTLSEMVWTTTPEGEPKDVSGWLAYTGMPLERMVNEGWVAAVHPQDVSVLLARWRSCLATGTPFDSMFRLRRHDGVYRWFLANGAPVRDAGGTITEWIGVARDVDDRRQIEDALRLSNHRLLAIIDLQQEIAQVSSDRCTIMRLVAERARDLVAADVVAVGRRDGDEIVVPFIVGAKSGPSDWIRVALPDTLAGQCIGRMQAMRYDDVEAEPLKAPIATRLGMRSALHAPLLVNGEATGILVALCERPAAFSDDELRTLEVLGGILGAALATARGHEISLESERELSFQARLLDSVEQAVTATDSEGRITYWNAYAEKQFGWSAAEAMGRNARDMLVPPALRDQTQQIRRRVAAGEHFVGDIQLMRRDGTTFTAHTSNTALRAPDGRMIGFIGVSRDVTKERELEEQLRHSQKLQAVGQLAGGVAHDFNNILTAMSGYAELVQAAVQDPAIRSDVDEIRHAARRGADLTRQLLSFSRKQVLQPAQFDAGDVIRAMQNMLRRVLREDIEFVVDVSEASMPLYADASQLEQVLLNLVVNARDAIVGPGRIELRAAPAPGGRMTLEVRDDGAGMSKATRERLFEPFFTTKPAGKGTGLGLAVVHGIVEQMQGTIAVESEPGLGTTFLLTFPMSAPTATPGEVARRASRQASRHTGARILLVEDNKALLILCQRVLESEGYVVVSADTPELALRATEGTTFDLVITDVVMPEMNGAALVDRLTGRGVTAPVIFMSGYTEDAAVEDGRARARSAFLPKPFTPVELSQTVRQVLDTFDSRRDA